MTEAYENDEDFKQKLVVCGRALDSVENAIRDIRFQLIEYFQSFEVYKELRVEKFIVRVLRGALIPQDFEILQNYETFKRRHGQTDEEKAIAKEAQKIEAKLSRWYLKIGNMMWGPDTSILANKNEG